MFTQNLSKNGKSAISIYQLNQLIDSFPDRPIQCVCASMSLLGHRPLDSYSLKDMSLYNFLRRLGCVKGYHKYHEVNSLKDLLALDPSESVMKFADTAVKDTLKFIESGKIAPTSVLDFQLSPRKQIIWEFMSYYGMIISPNEFQFMKLQS